MTHLQHRKRFELELPLLASANEVKNIKNSGDLAWFADIYFSQMYLGTGKRLLFALNSKWLRAVAAEFFKCFVYVVRASSRCRCWR
jgi:TRAP-type uncharacterized transport system substrate-binding protein